MTPTPKTDAELINSYTRAFGLSDRKKEWLDSAFAIIRQDERGKCRKIFIEKVDWAEWGMSDADAGEQFDKARDKQV